MLPSNPIRADFSSRIRLQRVSEELASAQRTIQEYEDLFGVLHDYACEHCKQGFESILSTGTGPTGGAAVVISSLSVASTTTPSPESVKPVWHYPNGLQIPHPPTSRGHHHPTARSKTQKAGSVSSKQSRTPARPDPDVTSPDQDQPQLSVKYNGASRLKVKLEHVWKYESPVACVKFSPHGKELAVELAEEGQQTLLYDVTVGEKTGLLADRYRQPDENPAPLWTNYLSFSSDGKYLATGHSHGQTVIWQVGKRLVRNAFQVNSDSNSSIVYVDFSPNGRFMATGSQNGGVRIWTMRDGSLTALHDDTAFRRALVLAVKFSPDGKHVAATDSKGTVRIWNVRTSKIAWKWKAHDIAIRSITFTPNGKGLVTGCNDRSLKYWDISQPLFGDAREVLKFDGHTDIIRSVAVSPDGKWLASGSDDHTIRIWNIKDATMQCSLLGHKGKVWSVGFSPTGNYVAGGCFDRRVSVWKYEPPSD